MNNQEIIKNEKERKWFNMYIIRYKEGSRIITLKVLDKNSKDIVIEGLGDIDYLVLKVKDFTKKIYRELCEFEHLI